MLSSELEAQVREYSNHSIDLKQLNEWLAARLPGYLENAPSDDSDLIGALELGMAEMDDGIATEDDLRESLGELLRERNTVESSVSFNSEFRSQNVTGSANETSSQNYVLEFPSSMRVQNFKLVYN
jgi:hypothetical protein